MHVQRTARGHSPGQTVIHVEMMVCHHQSHPTMLTTNGEAEELWQSWRHRLFWTTTETRQSSGTTRGRWSLGSLKNSSIHGPIDPLATEYAPLYNTCNANPFLLCGIRRQPASITSIAPGTVRAAQTVPAASHSATTATPHRRNRRSQSRASSAAAGADRLPPSPVMRSEPAPHPNVGSHHIQPQLAVRPSAGTSYTARQMSAAGLTVGAPVCCNVETPCAESSP